MINKAKVKLQPIKESDISAWIENIADARDNTDATIYKISLIDIANNDWIDLEVKLRK